MRAQGAAPILTTKVLSILLIQYFECKALGRAVTVQVDVLAKRTILANSADAPLFSSLLFIMARMIATEQNRSINFLKNSFVGQTGNRR